MDSIIQTPEFREGSVVLHFSFWTGTKILYDGKPVPNEKGIYSIPGADGQLVPLKLRRRLPDLIPGVDVNGRAVDPVRALPGYVWLWIGAPVLLMFAGGALGAVIGAAAAAGSASVFRSERRPATKWILSGLYSFIAVIVFLVCAALLQGLLKK